MPKKGPAQTKGCCALCKEDKDLRNSHIIPEFYYKSIYNEKHFMQQISPLPDVRETRLPKGYYERLLCAACEALIQRYEDEAKIILEDPTGRLTSAPMAQDLFRVTGFDYTLFKLFQLSILWRMSVAKGRPFAKVDLGQYEPIVRAMVHDGNPGKVGDFGCIMGILNHKGRQATQFMFSPIMERFVLRDSRRTVTQYVVTFGGYGWWFFAVPDEKMDAYLKPTFLQLDGSTMMRPREMLSVPGLNGALRAAALKHRS